AGNLSGFSPIAAATTPDTVPPTAPTGLTPAVISGTQINQSWTASMDNVGVTGYRVERCVGASCTSGFVELTPPPPGPSFSDTGAVPATSYGYRVRARDAAGNLSGFSPIAAATTPAAGDTQPPTAPTGLTPAVISGTQINLSWTASMDNVGVTGYRVERCVGASCTSGFVELTPPPPGPSFSDTGAAPATSYGYRVRARDAAGNLSGFSPIASATTLSPPPPVTGLVAAYGFNEGSGPTVTDASGNNKTGTI